MWLQILNMLFSWEGFSRADNYVFRYTASEVLAHPWVTGRGTDNVLETPANLRRNTSSATNLGNFAAKANEHYRYLNSGLNGLSEALDNLNLVQQLELEGNLR